MCYKNKNKTGGWKKAGQNEQKSELLMSLFLFKLIVKRGQKQEVVSTQGNSEEEKETHPGQYNLIIQI